MIPKLLEEFPFVDPLDVLGAIFSAYFDDLETVFASYSVVLAKYGCYNIYFIDGLLWGVTRIIDLTNEIYSGAKNK